jgi:hypothetical protein
MTKVDSIDKENQLPNRASYIEAAKKLVPEKYRKDGYPDTYFINEAIIPGLLPGEEDYVDVVFLERWADDGTFQHHVLFEHKKPNKPLLVYIAGIRIHKNQQNGGRYYPYY